MVYILVHTDNGEHFRTYEVIPNPDNTCDVYWIRANGKRDEPFTFQGTAESYISTWGNNATLLPNAAGIKKYKKHKSRKHNSRKHKSRKHNSRKHNSRKHKKY